MKLKKTIQDLELDHSRENDMSEKCDDIDSAELRGRSRITSVPLTTDVYTLNSINDLASDFERNIVFETNGNNPLNLSIAKYGSEAFYETLGNLNRFLKGNLVNETINITTNGQATSITLLSTYPFLNQRMQGGLNITPIELSEFMSDSLYTTTSLNTSIQNNYQVVLKQLNSFFEGNFTQSTIGAFCSVVPNIFGAINGFFDAIDSIKSFSLNLSLLQNFSLSALLSSLKSQLTNVFDKIIEKVKTAIENFSFKNVITQINTFVNNTLIAKATQLKEEALRFFSKENLDIFRQRINNLIDYATNLFKNPTLDEIQFLIYRFCGFASKVEDAIAFIKSPIDNFANSFDSTYQILAASGGQNTARSIRAGALRYSPGYSTDIINNIVNRQTELGNPPPINVEDIDGVTKWNEGKGDGRVTFEGGWVSSLGEEGWTRVQPEVRIRLMKLQQLFGKRLIVNSAYRSPTYNRSVGGARNSLHMSGMALDIKWSGISLTSREDFIDKALDVGFRGIGRYGTRFVHIDIGSRREWGS